MWEYDRGCNCYAHKVSFNSWELHHMEKYKVTDPELPRCTCYKSAPGGAWALILRFIAKRSKAQNTRHG